jgi:hypothetical protein
MKTILPAISIAFALLVPAVADDQTEATKVVDSFYAAYLAAMIKEEDGDKLVQKAPQLSPGFKKVHAALVAKAWKENPELGLGYDAIVCGQDFPNAGFAVTSITLKETTGSAVVSSKDKDFTHTIALTLVKQNGQWLINGIDKLKAP